MARLVTLPHRFFAAVARSTGGIRAAIRSRPEVFAAVASAVFSLDLVLPPLVLSLTRKPLDYFTFNPWLPRLPEYLASSDSPLRQKLQFLPNLALFWMSADSPFGGTDWGFAVDVSDLLRIVFTSLVIGAFFALWCYRRDRMAQCGWTGKRSRRGGIAGTLASILGLSTGPCSVMGCGAPVIPVVGLAFTGLSSETLKLMADLSKLTTAVVLLAMTVSVAYFGWTLGPDPESGSPPSPDPVSIPSRSPA